MSTTYQKPTFSYIGHPDVLSHIAIAENECRARVQEKVKFIQIHFNWAGINVTVV